VGAFVAVIALAIESASRQRLLGWDALAAYSVAGGAVAVVSRSLLALFVSAPAARAGAISAVAGFAALHTLLLVNVRALPGEHFLSAKSLAVDAGIVAVLVLVALWISRLRSLQAVRERWGIPIAAAGALSIVAIAVAHVTSRPTPVPARSRPGQGPDLVLIVLDSLRADRVPPGSTYIATPRLAEIAKRGRAYSQAWSASSWTVPSVARMLGVVKGQGPTLAERLSALGYDTACFTDNPHLTRGTSLLRGFGRVERSVGHWRDALQGTSIGEVVERISPGSDERLTDKAKSWTKGRSAPFFIYIHLMDSHTPYRFPPIDGMTRKGRRIEFPATGMEMTPEEAESIRARYDGGVRSADAQAGRILDALEASGRQYVAIVTSDHGESLGEEGRWFHGKSLAPELLAIPLIVVGNGVRPGASSSAVGHADIPPTLLATASSTCAQCVVDLRNGSGGGAVEGSLPPALAYRIDGRFKLVLDLISGERRLFDLVADPGEKHDLASDRPELADEMAQRVRSGGDLPLPDSDQFERLRSLGYAGF
jgi:arylsulfatase A-like enzyme